MSEPTVFIVDDDEAVRDSIKELVSSVGLAAETFPLAQSFLDAYDPMRPGCLVLDVRMTRMSGLALQAKLNEMNARIPIVFISGHGDVTMAVESIKAGAVNFVQKPYREQQLLDSINEALAKDAAVRSSVREHSTVAASLSALTDREREVMALTVQGLSSKLIAKELGISHRTVELHRSRVLEKLGVHTMAEVIRLAFLERPQIRREHHVVPHIVCAVCSEHAGAWFACHRDAERARMALKRSTSSIPTRTDAPALPPPWLVSRCACEAMTAPVSSSTRPVRQPRGA